MANEGGAGVGCLALAVLIGVLGYGFYQNGTLSTSKLVVYQVYCAKDLVNGQCPGDNYIQLNKTVYKVYPEQQVVVSSVNDLPPRKYSKCAIIDAGNWQCDYDSIAGAVFGFTNDKYWSGTSGVYGIVTETTQNAFTRNVSWWTYIMTQEQKRK